MTCVVVREAMLRYKRRQWATSTIHVTIHVVKLVVCTFLRECRFNRFQRSKIWPRGALLTTEYIWCIIVCSWKKVRRAQVSVIWASALPSIIVYYVLQHTVAQCAISFSCRDIFPCLCEERRSVLNVQLTFQIF